MKTAKEFVLVNKDNQEAYLFIPMEDKVKVQYMNWQPDGTDSVYVPQPFMARKETARRKWMVLINAGFKKADKFNYMHYFQEEIYWEVA
jgi:hypothetical protein